MSEDPFWAVYTADYFKKHSEGELLENTKALGRAVGEVLHPQYVFDVGCGVGAALAGVQETNPLAHLSGVDSPHALALIEENGLARGDRIFLHPLDLRDVSETTWRPRSDVTICLETAEHLPSEVSERLVQYVTRGTKYVVWTAAVPGQGGEGHLSEREPQFWAMLFKNAGFSIDWESTIEMRKRMKLSSSSWYRSVTVYRQEEGVPPKAGKGLIP